MKNLIIPGLLYIGVEVQWMRLEGPVRVSTPSLDYYSSFLWRGDFLFYPLDRLPSVI